MEKKSTFLRVLWEALSSPERSFDKETTVSVSRSALFLLIIILTAAGALLSARFHQNETMRVLTIEEVENRIDRMMASAPAEARAEAKARAAQSAAGGGSLFQLIFGTTFAALLKLIFVIEAWFLTILLMQFMGGEEAPLQEKKHRRSLYLALYAVIPLAIQDLAAGIILSLKDPAKIGNVLTLAEYQERTTVSLSLLDLFGLPSLPRFVEFVLYSLFNPFVLWTLAVALFGGRSVFRVKTGKMSLALAVLFILFGLQNQLFSLLQGTFGG